MKNDAPAPAEELFDEAFFQLASECTVEAWLGFLGRRWNALILYHLALGAKRFTEIQTCLPTCTPKVMTERLVALESRGLIERPNGARGGAYRLTVLGEGLMPILNALEIWARDVDYERLKKRMRAPVAAASPGP